MIYRFRMQNQDTKTMITMLTGDAIEHKQNLITYYLKHPPYSVTYHFDKNPLITSAALPLTPHVSNKRNQHFGKQPLNKTGGHFLVALVYLTLRLRPSLVVFRPAFLICFSCFFLSCIILPSSCSLVFFCSGLFFSHFAS